MKRSDHLQGRLFRALLGFGASFVFLLLAFMMMTYEAGQESLAQKILAEEVARWERAAEDGLPAELPDSAAVRGYHGVESLPPEIAKNLGRFEREDYQVPLREWKEINLWEGTHPTDGRPVFFILEASATEDRAIFGPNLGRALLLAAGLVAMLAAGVGWMVSRRLTRPLENLVREVDAWDPDSGEGNRPLAGRYEEHEVGVLARGFDALRARVERFTDRERLFTRGASHELRTPVTVVRGAHDVLRRELRPEPGNKVDRALSRIQTASEDMTTTIESFLWMAREEGAPELVEQGNPAEVVRQVADWYHAGLAGRPVTLSLEAEEDTHIQNFPVHLFRICAANLIRNALQHTGEGTVHIQVSPSELVVVDTGPGIPEPVRVRIGEALPPQVDSSGFGLGLAIVSRVAKRCGWTLRFESPPEGGTRARLRFA